MAAAILSYLNQRPVEPIRTKPNDTEEGMMAKALRTGAWALAGVTAALALPKLVDMAAAAKSYHDGYKTASDEALKKIAQLELEKATMIEQLKNDPWNAAVVVAKSSIKLTFLPMRLGFGAVQRLFTSNTPKPEPAKPAQPPAAPAQASTPSLPLFAKVTEYFTKAEPEVRREATEPSALFFTTPKPAYEGPFNTVPDPLPKPAKSLIVIPPAAAPQPSTAEMPGAALTEAMVFLSKPPESLSLFEKIRLEVSKGANWDISDIQGKTPESLSFIERIRLAVSDVSDIESKITEGNKKIQTALELVPPALHEAVIAQNTPMPLKEKIEWTADDLRSKIKNFTTDYKPAPQKAIVEPAVKSTVDTLVNEIPAKEAEAFLASLQPRKNPFLSYLNKETGLSLLGRKIQVKEALAATAVVAMIVYAAMKYFNRTEPKTEEQQKPELVQN